MISRGTSRLLSRGGIVFDPVNTSDPTLQTFLLPNPASPGGVHEAATVEAWGGIHPHVVGITRLHPSRRCGDTRVGGYFHTHLFPNALGKGRVESISLSPSFPERLFRLGRKRLHVLSHSGSQALIFGSMRRSREATYSPSSSQERLKTQAPARHTQGDEPRKTPVAKPRCPPSPTPHMGLHGGPGELPVVATILSDEGWQPLAGQNTRHLASLPAEELQTERREKIKDKAIN